MKNLNIYHVLKIESKPRDIRRYNTYSKCIFPQLTIILLKHLQSLQTLRIQQGHKVITLY